MKNAILYAFIAVAFVVGLIVGSKLPKNPNVVINNNVAECTLTDWQVMKLAIIKTESEFNPLAVGKSEDWGLLQIRDIYVREANRLVGYDKWEHEDAFCPEKALAMFDCVQDNRNEEHDILKAIKLHNGASWYTKKVMKNIDFVRNYEYIRELIKEGSNYDTRDMEAYRGI